MLHELILLSGINHIGIINHFCCFVRVDSDLLGLKQTRFSFVAASEEKAEQENEPGNWFIHTPSKKFIKEVHVKFN